MASPYTNRSPSLLMKVGMPNRSSSIGPRATPPRKPGRLPRSPMTPLGKSAGAGKAKLIATGGSGHCFLTRVKPSTMLARHFLRLSPLDGRATVLVTGLAPRMAEKRKFVPPASRVMTMRASLAERAMVALGRGWGQLPARAITVEAVEGDVSEGEHRHDEGVLNAEPIGDGALHRRQHRSAQNRQDEQGGGLALKRSKALDRQREDVRPHHGTEEADAENGPFGGIAGGSHAGDEEHDDHAAEDGQHAVRAGLAEEESDQENDQEDAVVLGVGQAAEFGGSRPVLIERLADSGQGQDGEKGCHRHEDHQRTLEWLAHIAQSKRAHEPSDHQAAPVERQIAASGFPGNAAQPRGAQEVDDGAAHRDFAADIHEDRQHAQGGMRMFEGAGARWNLIGVRKSGHMGEFEEHRQQHEGGGKTQVGNLHRVRAMSILVGEVSKDEKAADDRADGADSVK